MNKVPFEYLYGIDIAMEKLRPGAAFELSGNTFTKWNDPLGSTPPTWEEVVEQMEKDKLRYEQFIRDQELE